MRWFEKGFGCFERVEANKLGVSSFDLLSEIAEEVSPEVIDDIPSLYVGRKVTHMGFHAKGVFYGLDYGKTGHL